MALTAAEAFRDAACGRVVAMLATKDDAPEQVVRRLASALETEPTVVPQLRLDACLVMLLVGALLVLVCHHVHGHVRPPDRDEDSDGYEGDDDDEVDTKED